MTLTEKILISSKDNFIISNRIRIAIEETNKLKPICKNEYISTFLLVFDWLMYLDYEGIASENEKIYSFFERFGGDDFCKVIHKSILANNPDAIYNYYRINENTIWNYLVIFVQNNVSYFPI